MLYIVKMRNLKTVHIYLHPWALIKRIRILFTTNKCDYYLSIYYKHSNDNTYICVYICECYLSMYYKYNNDNSYICAHIDRYEFFYSPSACGP